MKQKLIFIVFALATWMAPTNLHAFESVIAEELTTPWEGFGYNQWGFARESDGNTFKPWDDDLWKTTSERILAIRPSLVRFPVIRDWFNKDNEGNNLPIGTYNWDSKYMQAYFKIMDLYKEHDIKVMGGFWHVTYNGEDEKEKDFYSTDDCARLQADLIEYLFRTKGYDRIITSYAPTNEPLGIGIPYDDWSTMIKKTPCRTGTERASHRLSVGCRLVERLDLETGAVQRCRIVGIRLSQLSERYARRHLQPAV